MRKNNWKKAVTGFLAAAVVVTSVPLPSVRAEEPEDVQWNEIEGIINSFSDKARWTTPDYGNVYSQQLPDSAMLGNGNTGITSAGNSKEKTYLIADSAFWSDNSRTFGYSNGRSPQLIAGGGITLKASQQKHEYNIAYGCTVTASSEKEGFAASRSVNGAYVRNPDAISEPFTGWEAAQSGPANLIMDLQFSQQIDRYVIKHDNATSGKGTERNTDSFKVQYLKPGVTPDTAKEEDWITIDAVAGNTSDTTDKTLDQAVSARYIRLLVEKPTADQGDQVARISQFELYDGNYEYTMPIEDNAPSTHEYNRVFGLPATASSGQDTAARAVNGVYQYTDSAKTEKFEGWVSEIGQEHFLTIDLKNETAFNRWTVKHNNYTTGNGAQYNTSDFSLEYSHDGESWLTADSVTGNEADETDRKLYYTTTARYVRLHITKPSQEDEGSARARISQFELYCDENYAESIATPDAGAEVTTSSDPYNGKSRIIDNTWETIKNGINDYSGWVSVHAQMPQWVQIDLGAEKSFDEWGMVHSGNELLIQDLYLSGNTTADHHASFPTGYRRFNPRDFAVFYSVNGDNWTMLQKYEGNTEGLSCQRLDSPITARYIKIEYTTGEQFKGDTGKPDSNQRARLAKVYLFNNQDTQFYKMPLEEFPASQTSAFMGDEPAIQEMAAENGQFLEQMDIAKAEIVTDMVIGETPVNLTTWIAPEEDILVTTLTSQGDKDQTLDVNVWGKNTLDTSKPNSDVDMTKTKPKTGGLSGIQEDMVWASRTTNVADDVLKDGTVKKARWMCELAMASKVIGGKSKKYANQDNNGVLRVTVPAGESVTIVTGVQCEENQKPDAENGAEGLAVKKAVEKIKGLDTVEEINQLHEEHQTWWQEYYKLSYADFGDADLNRLYYGSQYIFACCTREGNTAPGLYGVWANNDQMAWQGDYHLNYNFQAPYYGSYSSNRLREFSQPMFEVIARNIDKGLKSASNPAALKSIEKNWYWATREDLHDGMTDAVLYPVGIKQFDDEFTDSYLNQTMNALFCASQVLSYYKYTLDNEWLFEKHITPEGNEYTLYDFLVYDANFYIQWIEKKGLRIDKEYIKDSPSYPDGHKLTTKYSKNYTDKYPEYKEEMGDNYCYVLYDGAQEGSFDFNPSVITGGIKNLMDGLPAIGKEHAPSAEKYAQWQDVAEHIVGPEVTVFERNGKNIFGLSEDRGIRPISAPINMEFVHPGDQLSFDSDTEMLQIARDTLDQANWSMVNTTPKTPTMAARVQYDSTKLVNNIKNNVINKMRPNYYVDDNTHGWEKVGILEALNNMMVQSSNGFIKVFPVWRDGTNGKFTTIREKGAFLVSSQMIDNNVQYVEISSEKGQDLKLVNPWGKASVTVTDSAGQKIAYSKGSTQNSGENTIELPTQAGMTYRIEYKGVDKDALTAIFEQYRSETSTGYTQETWSVFETALKAAETVLSNPDALQEEIDTAAEALTNAAKALKVSKTTLEYYLKEAKQHVASGDVENLVLSVKKLFSEAIAQGEKIFAKENASKDEVFQATLNLIKAIQALDMKAGDKTDLGMAIELAVSINLELYVQKNQEEFMTAKAKAEEIMADGDAMQEEVDKAWVDLVEAMNILRLKADKLTLQQLLESVKDLDLSVYTEESAAVYRKALSNAQALMEDDTLSVDDQKKVDEAVDKLKTAKEKLVVKNNETQTPPSDDNTDAGKDEKPNQQPDKPNGQNGTNGTNGSNSSAAQGTIKTGDNQNIIVWVIACSGSILLLTGAAIYLGRRNGRNSRRRRNRR